MLRLWLSPFLYFFFFLSSCLLCPISSSRSSCFVFHSDMPTCKLRLLLSDFIPDFMWTCCHQVSYFALQIKSLKPESGISWLCLFYFWWSWFCILISHPEGFITHFLEDVVCQVRTYVFLWLRRNMFHIIYGKHKK